ncbi:MAG: sulfur carrier protein ThiS [Clostridiaceae bacterium]
MIINGKEYSFKQEITISELLEKLNLDESKVVVELNFDIIDKALYKTVKLKEKDSLEVISFVGGG